MLTIPSKDRNGAVIEGLLDEHKLVIVNDGPTGFQVGRGKCLD